MVRVYLHVAPPGQGGGPRPPHQPVAMVIGAASYTPS
jgi:hypothetical protein